MSKLFLRLNNIPVCKALQALLLIEICKSQIEICGIKLFVDLQIKDVTNVCVKCHVLLFPHNFFSKNEKLFGFSFLIPSC